MCARALPRTSTHGKGDEKKKRKTSRTNHKWFYMCTECDLNDIFCFDVWHSTLPIQACREIKSQAKSTKEWRIGRAFNRILNKSPVLHTQSFCIKSICANRFRIRSSSFAIVDLGCLCVHVCFVHFIELKFSSRQNTNWNAFHFSQSFVFFIL